MRIEPGVIILIISLSFIIGFYYDDMINDDSLLELELYECNNNLISISDNLSDLIDSLEDFEYSIKDYCIEDPQSDLCWLY